MEDTMESKNSNIVVKIEETVHKFEKNQLFNVGNFNVNNENYHEFVVAISQLVAKEYENLVGKLRGGNLEKLEESMSKYSYRSKRSLFEDITIWARKRQELIKLVDTSADSLDYSYYMSKIGRLLGSSVDLLYNLDSLTEHKISGFFAKEAYAVHPILGSMSEAVGKYFLHFAYLGLVSSFADVLNTTSIFKSILKNVNEDIELFGKIERWFQDTNELDEKLKELFPFGIDTNVVREIEQILADQDSHTKVFCSVFFSNVKHKLSLMKDEEFLSQAFSFSRKDIAKEWYERALKMNHPIEFEAAKLELRAKLMAISESSNPDVTVELGNQLVKLKEVPHFVQATINCVSIYFSFIELATGAKHKNSEFLRELSKRAKFCLDELENICSKLD